MTKERPVLVAATRLDDLLGWMDSLADATRLRLLRLLERHELGVAELCDVLQLPQSTVSRHLKILADQAWLRSRSHRTTNLYRMNSGRWRWASVVLVVVIAISCDAPSRASCASRASGPSAG